MKLDDNDTYILSELMRNSRIGTATLGRALKVSRTTVQNRIDRMVASGLIARFTVELGSTDHAATIAALILLKVRTGDTRQLIDKLRQIAAIGSITTLSGQYDVMLEIEAASTRALDELLAKLRRLDMVVETSCSIQLNRFK